MLRSLLLDLLRRPAWAGTLVAACVMLATVGIAAAQEATPPPPETPECTECHLDITDALAHSPHAHAFDDPAFQEWWQGHGETGECLSCHTTGYQSTTRTFQIEGIACEACHGSSLPDHPPAIVPVKADTEYCGSCHTTTLAEWRQTGHSMEDVGCTDCHDPHSQKALFAVADDLCINCHKGDMGDYLEDLHVKKGIGCVDCHALVIPPETPPEDGIVPTGHTFTITPATCVACHTDALHAGFALPGFENGAAETAGGEPTPQVEAPTLLTVAESSLSPDQRIQALETALASQNLTTLMQGGIVGLVLGASTAWFMAHNVRRRRSEEEHGEEES